MSVVVSRRNLLQMAMAPAFLTRAQVADLAPTVSRVYPGTDGRLVYVPDEHGNTIHDSSHAGYAGGGVPIPTVPVKLTIWPVAGDNTEHVQAAIDKVSALPQDKSGFRGAVLLRAGYYKMAMPLRIQASGVVLRGEGMGDTGTILVGTGTGRPPAPAGVAGPRWTRRPRRWSRRRRRIRRRSGDARADRGRVRRDDKRRNEAAHRRRIRPGRRAQLQGDIRPWVQTR